MLNIRLRDPNSKLNFDIDGEFLGIKVSDTPTNRKIISSIEQGEYISPTFFKDRFGAKLFITELSTGCKAALLVANSNLEVDLQECGYNAVNYIIMNLDKGNIVLRDTGISIALMEHSDLEPISVAIDGYHVKDLSTLNEYLMYSVDLDEPEYNAEKL